MFTEYILLRENQLVKTETYRKIIKLDWNTTTITKIKRREYVEKKKESFVMISLNT